MAFSWNTVLAPQETIQKEFTISLRYRKLVFATIIILSIAALFLVSWYAGLLLFVVGGLYWWYINAAKHYVLTNTRLVLVQSFPGVDAISIDYKQITNIEIEQSVVDQIGKWGTIVINTAGEDGPTARISFIENPLMIKQALDQVRDLTTATPQPIPPLVQEAPVSE